MTQVSVIVLCKNQQANLPRILTALARQSLKPEEVIIVDDRSVADIGAIAQSFGCKSISTGAHVNRQREGVRALARQIGTAGAEHDIVAYLDGDIIPSPGFLQVGVELAMTGKIVRAPRRYGIASDGCLRQYKIKASPTIPLAYLNFADFTSDSFLVRRDVVNAVGGWDEHFEGWGEEDIEFAFRCERNGLPIVEPYHQFFFGIHLDHPVDHANNFASLTKNACYFAEKHPAIVDLRTPHWKSMGLYLARYGNSERSR